MTIRENMPGLARPVRIVDKSSRATDTAFSIFSSASKRTSSIICPAAFPSGGDQRPDLLTSDRTGDIPVGQQVEHEDRHAIVHAQTECGGIGYPQAAVDDFAMADRGEQLGFGVHPRILVEHTVNCLGHENYVGADLQCPLCR